MYQFKDSYDRMTNPPTNWYQQAELYMHTYPECTNNQKAIMFANDMKREGLSVYLSSKTYKVRVTYVYVDGKQMWPIKEEK
jgi:hypothetical protein